MEQPVGDCLRNGNLQEKVLYIVLTLGVPLKVSGPGSGTGTEACSVDSELALLYAKLKGTKYQRAGGAAQSLLPEAGRPVPASASSPFTS